MFSKSKWIWLEGYEGENTYVSFADKVTVSKNDTDTYEFGISVDTNYVLYINGEMVDTDQYADYPFDKVYDKLDVTKYLKNGENEITIDVWHQGYNSFAIRNESAGLIYALTRGEEILAFSSENTLARPINNFDMGGDVEVVSWQLGRSFRYDARVPVAEYSNAKVVEKEMPVRVRPIKKLVTGDLEPAVLKTNGSFKDNGGDGMGKVMEGASIISKTLHYARKLPSEEGFELTAQDGQDGIFALIDTGRENTGVLALDIDLPEDAKILVAWGEHLEDLRIRTSIYGSNYCASFYGKKGRNKFVNYFRRLGCRYLQLHIYAKSAKIHYAGMKTTEYPLSYEAKFTCADQLHTKIYEVSKRTLLLCMHEHYEDCPWREQSLYGVDSRNQMLFGYYAFKEYEFAKASLRLLGQSLREDGLLEMCPPTCYHAPIPTFAAIYMTQLYEYVEYSGDVDFALEMLPVAKKVADTFLARTNNKYGLVDVLPNAWNFVEWMPGLDGCHVDPDNTIYHGPLSAFVSFGSRALAKICEKVGDTAAAEYYRAQHLKLNESLNKYLWDDERGAYVTYIRESGEKYHFAEVTNSLICYADAAPADRLEKVQKLLVTKDNGLYDVTISYSVFKYETLMKDPKKYARFVFNDIAEKWGHMLYNNATTFWETLIGAADMGNAGSLCHGWSAVPIYFYHKYALNMSGEDTGLYECKIED